MNSSQTLVLAVFLPVMNACSLQTVPPPPIGAGIIAVACKDHSAFYLLAREREADRSGWGHLGGTQKADEPLLATALREFNEETNCSFYLDHPHSLQISGPSRSGNFSTYHMKVEYLPVSHITESPVCRTNERDQWRWIQREVLLSALQTNTQPLIVEVAEGEQQSIPLWNAAAAALRQAMRDKVIPEKDPCIP